MNLKDVDWSKVKYCHLDGDIVIVLKDEMHGYRVKSIKNDEEYIITTNYLRDLTEDEQKEWLIEIL